jgi:hypothetical protein
MAVIAILALSPTAAFAHSLNSGQAIFYTWNGWGSYCATVEASFDHSGAATGWNGIGWARQFGNPCPGYPPGSWLLCGGASVQGTAQTVVAVNAPAPGYCEYNSGSIITDAVADTNFPGSTVTSGVVAVQH